MSNEEFYEFPVICFHCEKLSVVKLGIESESKPSYCPLCGKFVMDSIVIRKKDK